MGSGSENQDLPGFVVLLSGGTDPTGGKSLWGSGFLPSVYQGVQCRTSGAPILYSENPAGMDRESRRRSLDKLRELNEAEAKLYGDPETLTRIEQYELAYRMQITVPDVFDISQRAGIDSRHVRRETGRRFVREQLFVGAAAVEKGVRFVQLFDWGWDMHGTAQTNDLLNGLPMKCREVDQASRGVDLRI